LASTIHKNRQGGSALPLKNQQHFESVFGADLSSVRVHNGQQHNQLARSLNAKAFTVGRDIFFGPGHYKPATGEGERLLAHEVSHVLQQSTGAVQAKQMEPGVQMGQAGDAHELQADEMADAVMSSDSVAPIARRNGIYRATSAGAAGSEVIQREEDDEEPPQGFDYSLLPPSLSYRSGPFAMSANTSAAQLSLLSRDRRANLGYQYGGDLFLGGRAGGLNGQMGINPQSGVGSLSLGASRGGFNFAAGANTAGNFNLGFGYGAPLLPMPQMLGQQAGAAWQGAQGVAGALPAFMSNPMSAYDANRESIGAIGTFGSSLADIYGQQGKGGLPFGFGANISYSPETRWMLGLGVQGSF